VTVRITPADERPAKERTANQSVMLWLLAGAVTIAAAFYQRLTGPTHPARGRTSIGRSVVVYKLPRSADTGRDCEVELRVPDQALSGRLEYRPAGSREPLRAVPLDRKGEILVGLLPEQPAAGKLAYRVLLLEGNEERSLTGDRPVTVRFKGAVPAAVLYPHILIMFLGMLLSTRAGLTAAFRQGPTRTYARWAIGLLITGGMIFGPIVQKIAFGAFWTGFPLGHDLTDSKTLLSVAVWLAALIIGRKGRPARGWVLAASLVTLAVYIVPHSLLGS
jgi:hypothetical protein